MNAPCSVTYSHTWLDCQSSPCVKRGTRIPVQCVFFVVQMYQTSLNKFYANISYNMNYTTLSLDGSIMLWCHMGVMWCTTYIAFKCGDFLLCLFQPELVIIQLFLSFHCKKTQNINLKSILQNDMQGFIHTYKDEKQIRRLGTTQRGIHLLQRYQRNHSEQSEIHPHKLFYKTKGNILCVYTQNRQI